MSIWVLTDRHQAARPLTEVVRAAVDGGASTVLLREKDLPRAERFALAEQLRAVIPVGRARLIVAGPDPLGGDAIHLAAGDPPAPAGGQPGLIGRSCHHDAELAGLTTEDYALVSPFQPTPSKPEYGPPLGPDGLAALVRQSPVPVIALGGISTADHVRGALAAGAVGVAIQGAIMRADDPAALVAELLAAARTVETSGAVHARPARVPRQWGGSRDGVPGALASAR